MLNSLRLIRLTVNSRHHQAAMVLLLIAVRYIDGRPENAMCIR